MGGKNIKVAKYLDTIFALTGLLLCFLSLGLITVLFIDLFIDGASRLNYKFFTSFPSRFPEKAGILSAWVGSFAVMIVTAISAIPLGVGAGIYLEEYAKRNWFTNLIEINIANLAGVPSIIYGLLALGLFVYILGFGESILTGGLALGLLILPIVITATREAIRAIPQSIREASFACGATRWQTIAHHVLPYSMGGILTGIIIGLSRAIGETAPLITVGALTFIAFLPSPPLTFEFPFISFKWLFDGFTVMPVQIFNWVSRPQKGFHVNAAAASIVLMIMTLLMNGLAIYIRYRFRKRIRW
ncbi:MAG: phosphate ABC transporter permease PstA [Deltaproteobacteria bacterium]|nr:phosphate ABC transporter permease PstA [Deltaproteobacteria bacterium]